MTGFLASLIGATALWQGAAPKWKLPYEVMPAPTSVAPFEERLKGGTEAVWLEGDVLTFVCRSKADLVRLAGAAQAAMTRMEGTDLWVIQLRIQLNWLVVMSRGLGS